MYHNRYIVNSCLELVVSVFLCCVCSPSAVLGYDNAIPEDGPPDLGDKIVWFKNGAIRRADGPAMEFKDGRKLQALDGREVSEQEFIA